MHKKKNHNLFFFHSILNLYLVLLKKIIVKSLNLKRKKKKKKKKIQKRKDKEGTNLNIYMNVFAGTHVKLYVVREMMLHVTVGRR